MTIWALGLFFLSLFGGLLGELFFGELSSQDAQDVIQRLLLEVGLLEQLLTASTEHAQRLKMADFPEGAELVPNPFNNIAGFSDLCAGPGGKAALLGALGIQRGASLVANEAAPHRAQLVESSMRPIQPRPY